MTIAEALEHLGRDPATRGRIVAALTAFEQQSGPSGLNVRDEITGPIVDALHVSAGTLRKTLSNGLVFEFPYRSKIARDFVMSVPEVPDHVWEPQTTKLLLHLTRAARHVVVAGAYFGDQAVPIADALRERGACHAFEADPGQAAMLRRNAELNRLDNLHVHAVGLWSDSASRLSFIGEDALARPVASTEGFPVTTIDDHAAAAGLEGIDLIMLDVEGGELEILRGAERTLSANKPHVVFEIHNAYTDWSDGLNRTEIVRYLASFGYTFFAVRDYQSNVDLRGQPIELVPLDGVYLEGPPHGFNLVAVVDPAVLSGSAFRIVPDVSPKLLRHRGAPLHRPSEEVR